ncbi:hypothetical protein O5D80_005524 [Batrachochytrium dendrobatidis]|nr:hypothetical protein O5D80_005524 [Batrachochytrium dendrobatidis]
MLHRRSFSVLNPMSLAAVIDFGSHDTAIDTDNSLQSFHDREDAKSSSGFSKPNMQTSPQCTSADNVLSVQHHQSPNCTDNASKKAEKDDAISDGKACISDGARFNTPLIYQQQPSYPHSSLSVSHPAPSLSTTSYAYESKHPALLPTFISKAATQQAQAATPFESTVLDRADPSTFAATTDSTLIRRATSGNPAQYCTTPITRTNSSHPASTVPFVSDGTHLLASTCVLAPCSAIAVSTRSNISPNCGNLADNALGLSRRLVGSKPSLSYTAPHLFEPHPNRITSGSRGVVSATNHITVSNGQIRRYHIEQDYSHHHERQREQGDMLQNPSTYIQKITASPLSDPSSTTPMSLATPRLLSATPRLVLGAKSMEADESQTVNDGDIKGGKSSHASVVPDTGLEAARVRPRKQRGPAKRQEQLPKTIKCTYSLWYVSIGLDFYCLFDEQVHVLENIKHLFGMIYSLMSGSASYLLSNLIQSTPLVFPPCLFIVIM